MIKGILDVFAIRVGVGGQINLNPFSLGSIPQGFNHQIEDGIDTDMDGARLSIPFTLDKFTLNYYFKK